MSGDDRDKEIQRVLLAVMGHVTTDCAVYHDKYAPSVTIHTKSHARYKYLPMLVMFFLLPFQLVIKVLIPLITTIYILSGLNVLNEFCNIIIQVVTVMNSRVNYQEHLLR